LRGFQFDPGRHICASASLAIQLLTPANGLQIFYPFLLNFRNLIESRYAIKVAPLNRFA